MPDPTEIHDRPPAPEDALAALVEEQRQEIERIGRERDEARKARGIAVLAGLRIDAERTKERDSALALVAEMREALKQQDRANNDAHAVIRDNLRGGFGPDLKLLADAHETTRQILLLPAPKALTRLTARIEAETWRAAKRIAGNGEDFDRREDVLAEFDRRAEAAEAKRE